jgi:hypothetical protein
MNSWNVKFLHRLIFGSFAMVLKVGRFAIS